RLAEGIARGSAIVSPDVLALLAIEGADALACTRRFVDYAVPAVAKMPAAPVRSAGEKIRLAYLSGDFHPHPVTFLLPQLFERHDRARFEVIAVSFGRDDKSDLRARIVAAVDQFHDVRARSDRDAANLLRELGVDIAIDLSGHSENSRIGILAGRPAAVQV